MKEKKKAKLKLEDIKVESFMTSLDDVDINRVIGGTTGSDDGDLCPNTCPATCTCVTNNTCNITYVCGSCPLTGMECMDC
jgi:hypothetical protein